MHSPLRVVSRREAVAPAPIVSPSIVLLTAVDGVLRHGENESCAGVRTALDLLSRQAVPVVLVSHDEPEPVQRLQHQLDLVEPFVCHGGATLYIPRGYFEELDGLTAGDAAWEVFEFGVPDPARAVRLLTSLYAVRGEDVLSIGFGCDWRDRMLLAAVDVPIVVRRADAEQERLLRRFPEAYVTEATGPAGWSEAVLGSAL